MILPSCLCHTVNVTTESNHDQKAHIAGTISIHARLDAHAHHQRQGYSMLARSACQLLQGEARRSELVKGTCIAASPLVHAMQRIVTR